jgi:hypothetical protein
MFTTDNEAINYLSQIGNNNPTANHIANAKAGLEEALKGRLIRAERDKLISKTDWWVLPDRTPSQAELNYRQQLRDFPSTLDLSSVELNPEGLLVNVQWPKNPNIIVIEPV